MKKETITEFSHKSPRHSRNIRLYSSESDIMLEKCSTWKSSLNFELALPLLMILVVTVTLHFAVGKLSKRQSRRFINIEKKHTCIKRKQIDAYREMKASLTDEDIILHVDFAGSYRSNQQDPIQSAHFGNQSFSIFTACCYKPVGSDDLKNDRVLKALITIDLHQ